MLLRTTKENTHLSKKSVTGRRKCSQNNDIPLSNSVGKGGKNPGTR